MPRLVTDQEIRSLRGQGCVCAYRCDVNSSARPGVSVLVNRLPVIASWTLVGLQQMHLDVCEDATGDSTGNSQGLPETVDPVTPGSCKIVLEKRMGNQ